jgi:O-antigen ligase
MFPMTSLQPVYRANNRFGLSTLWTIGTVERVHIGLAIAVLGLAVAATVTISIRDPRAGWAYELVSFVLAAIAVWQVRAIPLRMGLPLVAIAGWGFIQLAFGATVYSYVTLDASLRMTAFGATALASLVAFRSARLREILFRTFTWFGFAMAVTGVIAAATSPGKLLWIFPSPYPDTWGFFLSRNNFAQFLELALPVGLWRARDGSFPAILMAAAMLAAGIASASRAGAILLIAETIVGLILLRQRWSVATRCKLAAACVVFTAIAGASELRTRLAAPDPLEYRRQFTLSTLAMIGAHPWRGFGLGTFADVYPAYARFDAGAMVDHAHDDWLEWAAEGGVLYGVAWIALAIAVTPLAIRSVWGIGAIAVFLHAGVDYPFARLGVAAWVFVFIGALMAGRMERSAPRRPPIRQGTN